MVVLSINVVGYVNWGISLIGQFLAQALSHLPSDPFYPPAGDVSALQSMFGYAAYFLPISEFFGELGVVLAAIILWYGVRLVLRAEVFGFSLRGGGD